MICGHGHEQKFRYPYPKDSKKIQMRALSLACDTKYKLLTVLRRWNSENLSPYVWALTEHFSDIF